MAFIFPIISIYFLIKVIFFLEGSCFGTLMHFFCRKINDNSPMNVDYCVKRCNFVVSLANAVDIHI